MSLVRVNYNSYHDRRTPEQLEMLAQIWPELLTISETNKYVSTPEKIMDIADIPALLGEVSGFEIKPLPVVRFVTKPPPFRTDKMEEVKEFVKHVNQIVMPGFELLKYGAIRVIENACTDSIQTELDEGWRIIAVLPQTNARRPDYILVKEQR